MTNDIIYRGWIPGEPEDEQLLRDLGVHGEDMTWTPWETSYYACGAFVRCKASADVVDRLVEEYGLPNPHSWTGFSNDKQLPRKEQRFWSYYSVYVPPTAFERCDGPGNLRWRRRDHSLPIVLPKEDVNDGKS